MFKKITAIVLSLALLLVGVFVAPITSAEASTQLVQDFEDYEVSGNKLVAYTLYTSDGADGNAHSGTKSIYRAETNATYSVAVFPNATTSTLVSGKNYELRFWIKIASAVPGTSTIQLMYSADKSNAYSQVSGSSKPNISVLKTSGSTNVDTTKVGEWQEIVYQFTATHTGHLTISGWGTSEYYLDDITIKEIKPTTITFNANGGSTVEPKSGNAGSQITMPESPTKAGFVFEGWYTNEELTEKFAATVFPESDITLYAKWRAEGVIEQDFESYSTSSSSLVAYTLYTSNGTDDNAHSGTKSVYRAANSNTYGLSAFPDATTQSLVEGKEYELRFWIKIVSAVPGTSTIQLMYSQAKNNANTTAKVVGSSTPNIAILKKPNETSTNIDTTKVGEWQEIVYKFTATHTGHLAITGWGTSEYYLDDITLCAKQIENIKTTITFETNTALKVADIENYAGAPLELPIPVSKTDKVLEGWYTDEELTNKFESDVQPNEDIILYAKWVSSIGGWTQDFETWNSTLNDYNTANSTSKSGVTDADIKIEEYDEVGYALHYNSADNNDNRVVINIARDKANVKDFIANGDTVRISIKYKVVSGSATSYAMLGINDSTNPSTGDVKYLGAGYTEPFTLSSTSNKWITATKYFNIVNESSDNLVTFILLIKGQAELYIDDVEIYNANKIGIATNANGYAAIRGATIDKKQGVRGYHVIDKDWLNNNHIVEYGLLAVKADLLEGNDLTVQSAQDAPSIKQAVVWNETTKPLATLWAINKNEYVFTSVLTGIIPENYGAEYYVRVYAKDSSGNYIYADVAQYTIYNVVYSILNTAPEDSADYLAAKTVKDEDPTAYESWVSANIDS